MAWTVRLKVQVGGIACTSRCAESLGNRSEQLALGRLGLASGFAER